VVAVDGSDPEALGVVWLPWTAVGEGDEQGGDGDRGAADGEAADDEAAGSVGGVVGVGDGDPLCTATGALCVTVFDGLAELGEELALA